jgi:hypothetical protein
MAFRIFSRQSWRPVGTRGTPDSKPKRELYVHHSVGTFGGPAPKIDTAKEQAEVMRRIDGFHKNSNGWAGIGYNFVLFQPYGLLKRARIFEGRGWDYIPAAQAGHNAGTVSICVVDDPRGNRLKLSSKLQLIRFARLAKKRGVQSLGGHRDAPGQSTACPGPYIYPALDEIARRAGLRRKKR